VYTALRTFKTNLVFVVDGAAFHCWIEAGRDCEAVANGAPRKGEEADQVQGIGLEVRVFHLGRTAGARYHVQRALVLADEVVLPWSWRPDMA